MLFMGEKVTIIAIELLLNRTKRTLFDLPSLFV